MDIRLESGYDAEFSLEVLVSQIYHDDLVLGVSRGQNVGDDVV